MSLSKPTKDKMMKAPPAQKGFHFAGDGTHEAMFIEAASIEEAEAIYHKTKKSVGGPVSTATAAPVPEEKDV